MHGWKIKPNNLLWKRVLLSSDEDEDTGAPGWRHGFEDAGGSIMVVVVVENEAEAAT